MRFFKTKAHEISKLLIPESLALHVLCVRGTYISASMLLVLSSFIALFPFTEVLQFHFVESCYSAAREMRKKHLSCLWFFFSLIPINYTEPESAEKMFRTEDIKMIS